MGNHNSGRRPKPPGVRLAGSAATPSGDCPACPWTIQDDPVAAEEWDRMAPILHAGGRLSDESAPVLALYCEAFSRFRAARLEYLAGGPTVSTDMGGSKANPAASIASKASADMVRILAEFGCTPASRSKAGVAAAPPEDKLTAFLKRKAK